MASEAVRQVWANSRAANGALLVLLAIADEADDQGNAEMSMTEIARKARMSESTARRGVRELEALGELSVDMRSGVRTVYVVAATPVNMTGVVEPTPVNMTGVPQSKRPGSPTPVNMTGAVNMTGVEPETSRSEATPDNMTGVENLQHVVSTTGRSLVAVKDVPAKPERLDVERLCRLLADRIEGNGSKRPAITVKWRDSARLLLDKDGRTEEQVTTAINWCQDHEFWRANILSMPKLREKYDQLRLQATRERNSPQKTTTSDRVRQAMEAGQRVAAMMNGASR
jgi:DNA-binding Lrp family transcriptional regulator